MRPTFQKRRPRGTSQVYALLLAALLAAAPAFAALGGGLQLSVRGSTSATAAPPTLSVGSRTAAGVASAIAALGDSGRALFSQVVESSKRGDVFETLQGIKRLLLDAPDSAFADAGLRHALDASVQRAFLSSNYQNQALERGLLGVTRRSLASDRSFARRLDEMYQPEEVEKLFDNITPKGVALTDKMRDAIRSMQDARRLWVAYFLHEDTRAMMLRGIDDDARAFTDDVWTRLDDLAPEERTVDIMTIGAGLASSDALATVARIEDDLRVAAGARGEAKPTISRLAIEASDSASSNNFRTGGRAFAYNMAIRLLTLFGPEGPGKYANLAPLDSPVNPADLTGLKYGPARNYGEAAGAALRASDSDVMVGTKVIDVVEDTSSDAPGFFKVTLSRNGEEKVIWANVVLDAVGAGKPKPIGDEATKAFINSELSKLDIDDPTSAPLIMTGRDDLNMSGIHPEWRDTRTVDPEDSELRDLVIGEGDSAFTDLEDRLGLSFQNHARANAQRGLFNGIDFAVGQGGPRTSIEYVLGSLNSPAARIRYIDIVTPMIKALDNYLQSRGETYLDVYSQAIRPFIEKNDASVLVTEKERLAQLMAQAINEGFDFGPETIALRPARVNALEEVSLPSGRRVVRATYSDGSTQLYRRAFLTAGYESPSAKWLQNEFPGFEGELQKTNRLNVIRADGSVILADQVGQVEDAVARRIPDKPYYFIGLNAGADLIPESRRAGVTENNAAYFNWGPLIKSLVKGIFDQEVIRAGNRPPLRRDPELLTAPNGGRISGVFDSTGPATQREMVDIANREMLVLRTELAKALSRLELDAERGGRVDRPVELVLTFDRNEDGSLRWTSGLELPNELVDGLTTNRGLTAVLERLISRGQAIEMRALFRTGQDKELYGLPRTLREDTMRIAER